MKGVVNLNIVFSKWEIDGNYWSKYSSVKHKKKTRIVRESDYSPASQLFCRVKKTMTGNYHKLDLFNIDAHTKFGLIMSIRSQDIERKRKSDLNKGP